MNLVPVGQILVMQGEFRKVAAKPHQPQGLIRRADLMIQLLEEVLTRRQLAAEKEATDATAQEPAGH